MRPAGFLEVVVEETSHDDDIEPKLLNTVFVYCAPQCIVTPTTLICLPKR